MNEVIATATSAIPLLIEGAALTEQLIAIGREENLQPQERRAAILHALKGSLEAGRGKARAFLESGPKLSAAKLGLRTAQGLSHLIDSLIEAVFAYITAVEFPTRNPTAAERIAIVATGGYGRGTLAPGSDVDLLFVLPYKQTPWGESVVEATLYLLWDIGLKVGHATRSVPECLAQARRDLTIRTSLLESRFLAGDERLYRDLRQKFAAEIARSSPADFIDAKLAEREARHERTGGSRYQVEPNLKDGKGGLRDLHTLFWIGKYVYRVETARDLIKAGVLTQDEFELFDAAEAFLWEVRCHLHFIAGRAEEKLSFDRQLDLADRLGFADEVRPRGVERFMKRYFRVAKDVGDLTRIFCAALEEQHKKRWTNLQNFFRIPSFRPPAGAFTIESNRIQVVDDGVFERDPTNLIRIFHEADAQSRLIHPRALRLIARSIHLIDDDLRANADANRLFLEILASRGDPERALRNMNEAGVFGPFIPDFGRIVAMMQFNMYHHYTVDEHLIMTIGNLAGIERGQYADEHPLANEIVHKLQSRNVLYLAALLHDIAKGREEDHSEAGAEIARELGPRLGLSPSETDAVAWLVENHLVMSTFAQSRDVADPKTIEDFAAIVQSPERLKLLLILTVADIRAVGPGVWNGWKGELLRTLYFAAEERLLGGHSSEPQRARIAQRQDAVAEALKEWPVEARDNWLDRHMPAYWLGLDTSKHVAHAWLTREADLAGRRFAMAVEPDEFRSVTALTIYTGDAPGLFAKLAGTISSVGATIQDAKAFTTHDGMALDVFWIQDNQGLPLFEASQVQRLRERLEAAIEGRFDPSSYPRTERFGRRLEAFALEPRVLVDNLASEFLTVVEVNARDRQGLLFDLAKTLSAEKLRISSAHIATFGERVVDVFYLKDAFGLKIVHPHRIERLKMELKAAALGRDPVT